MKPPFTYQLLRTRGLRAITWAQVRSWQDFLKIAKEIHIRSSEAKARQWKGGGEGTSGFSKMCFTWDTSFFVSTSPKCMSDVNHKQIRQLCSKWSISEAKARQWKGGGEGTSGFSKMCFTWDTSFFVSTSPKCMSDVNHKQIRQLCSKWSSLAFGDSTWNL